MNRRTAIAAILSLPALPKTRSSQHRLLDGEVIVVNLHGKWTRLRVDGNKLRVVGGTGYLPREHLGAFWMKDAR